MPAIDFPSAPTLNQEFVTPNVTYVWNGQGWTLKPAPAGGGPIDAYTRAESDGRFVNVPGDTMTGDLTISKLQPTLTLNKPSTADVPRIIGTNNGVMRWAVTFGNLNAESEGAPPPAPTAGNGSDFEISRYTDAGALIDSPLTIWRYSGDLQAKARILSTRENINSIATYSADSNRYLGMGLKPGGNAYLMFNDIDLVINASDSKDIAYFYRTGGMILYAAAGSAASLAVHKPNANYSVFLSQCQFNYGGLIAYAAGGGYYGIVGFNSGADYSFYGYGNALLTSGTWGSSDGRFKQNVTPLLFDAASVVKAVPVKRFNWNPAQPIGRGDLAGETSFGWVAQDVEPHLPTAVANVGVPAHDLELRAFLAGAKLPAKDTPEAQALSARTDLTYKAINDHYMVAVLWKAVQELTARLETLEAAPKQ